MNKNTKRFAIQTIMSCGCNGMDMLRHGEERHKNKMELVGFMLGCGTVSKFKLDHMQESIAEEIRKQFPKIDFLGIEARAVAAFGREYDSQSRKYKRFFKSIEDSFGKTRAVQQVDESFVYPPPHFYMTGDVPESYVCAICGATRVKLWRPYGSPDPLICANCAEELQSPQEQEEREPWVESTLPNGDPCWTAGFTGKKIPMGKWVVGDDGTIPSHIGSSGPDGKWEPMTDQLGVDLKGKFEGYSSGDTSIVPAVPYSISGTYTYHKVPDEGCDWWNKLPTHSQP